MRKSSVFSTIAAQLLAFALILPGHAADSTNPTACKDGTTSSATGKGACSGHGGVQKATNAKPAVSAPVTAAPSAATPVPAVAAPAAPAAKSTPAATKSAPVVAADSTDPTGATAKCKDGTYSKSQHHSGTCSSHGGVAEWLTTTK